MDEEFVGIKELNKKHCSDYKNKLSIPLPSLHNTEEELLCIKELLFSWITKQLVPKNKSTRYVCDCILYVSVIPYYLV